LKILDKTNIILFSLLPFAILTGPFLADLFLSLIGLFFLINNYRAIKKHTNYLIISLFICYVLFIYSSIKSEDILYSFDYSLFYFRFIVFLIATSYLLLNFKDKIILYIYPILYFCLLILCLDSLIEFFFHRAFFGLIEVEQNSVRLKSLFILIDEPVVGAYISKLLPLLIGFYILSNNRNFNQFCFLVHFCFLIIFLSGERIALFYAFITFFLFHLIFFKKRFSQICIFLLMITIFTSITLKPKIYDRMITQTLDQTILEENKEISKTNLVNKYSNMIFNFYKYLPSFSNEHLSFINTSLKMHETKPILGFGPKMFDLNCELYSQSGVCPNHPHQIYFQILSESGFLPVLIIFSIFIFLTFNLLKSLFYFNNKSKLQNQANIFMLLAPVMYLLPIIPTGSFFTNWNTVLFYFSFSLGIFFIKNET